MMEISLGGAPGRGHRRHDGAVGPRRAEGRAEARAAEADAARRRRPRRRRRWSSRPSSRRRPSRPSASRRTSTKVAPPSTGETVRPGQSKVRNRIDVERRRPLDRRRRAAPADQGNVNFCDPQYLGQMVSLIYRNWSREQPPSPAKPIIRFVDPARRHAHRHHACASRAATTCSTMPRSAPSS